MVDLEEGNNVAPLALPRLYYVHMAIRLKKKKPKYVTYHLIVGNVIKSKCEYIRNNIKSVTIKLCGYISMYE